jgi:hypothetical protein
MISAALALKAASAVLTVVALGTGSYAAILSHRASRVPVDPGWGDEGQMRPVIPEFEQMGWTVAFLRTASASGKLNERAARWTIAAVILSGVASLIGLAADLTS